MRKLLLGIFIGLFILNTNAQVTGFKKISKEPAGTHPNTFSHGTTDGRNALKSTATSGTSLIKPLSFSGVSDKPLVLRKGNAPVYIERKVSPLKSASSVTYEDRFYRFMEESKSVTNVDNAHESFKITDIRTDELGITHVRTVQQYRGIEVYGTESVFHISRDKERFTGSLFINKSEINTQPSVMSSLALLTVKNDLKNITVLRDLSEKEKVFLHYTEPDCSLNLFATADGSFTLAWMITIRPNFVEEWQYVIDAGNGKIIRKFNNTKSDGPTTGSATDLNNVTRTVDVYLEAGTYYLVNMSEPMYNADTQEGMIMTLDANNTSTSNLNYSMITSGDNTWSTNQSAISAHYNAFMAYEYFRSKFNRNSINGQGGNIVSFVNVTEDGSSMENAFWNGQAVFYGNGGSHFKSLSGGLDVSAHELGHGVISNSANLEYYGQAGAINESFADIFGSMVDREDWLIGEDVVKTAYYPTGALRSMSDPHNGGTQSNDYWQPAHLSEMYIGEQDNGGVHINSGIGNLAFYLFATAVTKDKAERVFYRALTEYLTKTSQFIDLRIAVVQAAKDLYGNTSNEAVKAGDAFSAVGIYLDEPETEDPGEYTPNPGQEFLLIYNTDENYVPTLYTSPASGNLYEPLSSTVMKGKVSVTDDGSAAVFVDADDRINVMTLNPDDLFEEHLSEVQFYDNAAVSKDGNRLAAVSIEEDASVYVYDFGTQEWHTFILYNPTTSDDNINAGGVLFADALEFDHTGEYLMYDAYNQLNSNTSEDISYWDVGFIKVWDNENNTFGDGSILKLFTQLPANVSIGNPVFSKNSPSIIAFDYYYYDGTTEEFAIYGANLETGDLGLITENTTLGFPSFSRIDDRLAYTFSSGALKDDIYTVALGADKISASGSPALLMEYAKWPVYYAIGEREIGLAPVANFTADFKTGGAPLQVKFMDLSLNDPTSWQWTFQGGTPATSTEQHPEVVFNNIGTYRVTLKATNSTGENTIDREGYIVVTEFTSTEDMESGALMYFPNPVENILNILYDGRFTVKIFNQAGKLLLSSTDQRQVNLSTLSSGLYILEIETEAGTTRHKLLKQ